MELTAEQREILAGAQGGGKAMAMRIQVGVGKCFDAPRLVPVARAHVALSAQEADVWFAGKLLAAGARCAVAPTVNPGYSLEYFQDRLTPAAIQNMQSTHQIYQSLGARLTYSCTPYLADNVPQYGEIVAFSETNATVYVNAVLGARTNRESAASALCAAVTGFVPEYGMLLAENRFADIAVLVEPPLRGDFDYAVLGLAGKRIGKGIPAFVGLPGEIGTESLIALGAELNVSGNYDLYHIPGVTAESRRIPDVFGGKPPRREVTLTQSDLEQVLEEFSPGGTGDIYYCVLGCPHYTYRQIQTVAQLLDGSPSRVPIYILTSATVKRAAVEAGLEDELRTLGAEIIADTCVDEPCCWGHLAGKGGVTDSPKGAYYMQTAGISLTVRDMATCIRWAKKGRIC
ncbi:aconitase X catalytic domain-containing protein [Oscillibacter sp. GMB15532]|uniref:aconitase X catalytic domain-containing protein n=1 Tax=Oscillibacter sp. GMB15532 TaxID=3230022 RepID=UPI0034E02626